MKKLCLAVWLALTFAFVGAASLSVPQAVPDVTKIDITEHTDQAHKSWEKLTDLAGKIAWPITVLLILVFFQSSIRKVIEHIGTKGGKISFGGLGIELPDMQRAAIDDDVLSFKTSDAISITNDSAKRTLLKMLREPGFREYVVINLGNGKEWISSRLFIFALMLQRMKGIQCIVFLEGSVPKFLGLASPDDVRWSLAQDQPWLEQAYVYAYGAVSFYQPGDSFVVSRYGALDAQVADSLVRTFIQRITSFPDAPVPLTTRDWAVLGNSTEFGTWLSGADVQKILGEGLRKDVITASDDPRSEAKTLLQSADTYVARVKRTGEFMSLVNRVAFVDQLTTKLVARLELLKTSGEKPTA